MSGSPIGSGFGSASGSTVLTRSYPKKPTAPPANGGSSSGSAISNRPRYSAPAAHGAGEIPTPSSADLEPAEVFRHGRVWIGRIQDAVGSGSGTGFGSRPAAPLGELAVAPAQDRAGTEAKERPAAKPPLLSRLEQERRALASQLQKGADGRLQVVDEPVANRDHVRGAGQLASALRARLDPRQVGRGADRAHRARRRAFRIWSTSAIETPRERRRTARW